MRGRSLEVARTIADDSPVAAARRYYAPHRVARDFRGLPVGGGQEVFRAMTMTPERRCGIS